MSYISRDKLKTLLIITICILLLVYAANTLIRLIAAPLINNYITQKAQQYGIKFTSQTITLTGAIHLTDVRTNLKNGSTLKIAELIIRPNFSILPGYAKAKQLDFTNDKVKIHLDSIRANNIAHNHNNIETSLLAQLGSAAKLLYKYNIGSILLSGGRVYLTTEETAKPISFSSLEIHSLRHGLVEKLKLYNLRTIIISNDTSLLASANYLESNKLNLDYLLKLYHGQASINNPANYLWQNLKLRNSTFANLNLKQTAYRLHLQDFYSGPLYLKAFPTSFKQLLIQLAQERNKQDIFKASEIIANSLTQASVGLQGLAIALPNITLNLSQAALQPKQWESLIPRQLFASFDRLVILPTKKAAQPITISGKLNFDYNEKNSSFTVNPMNFSASNLCSLHSIFEFKNVNKALFTSDGDPNKINDVRFKNAYISYIDKGIIPALITSLSQASELPYEEIKDLVYSFIEKSPPLFIEDKDAALHISQFLIQLAEKPQKVDLWIKAKESANINLGDLFNNLHKNPSYLINNLDLQVKNKLL